MGIGGFDVAGRLSGIVAGVVRGGDRTVWVVRRDERMMQWFAIVRLANVQTIRWVLGALNGWTSPVSSRQAQSWCSRMRTAGLIDAAQLGGPGGSVVWATYAGIGRSKPDLFRQTTRHELSVAAASARYAAAGYAWERDDKAAFTGGHQADGIAIGPGWIEHVEVELTGKRLPRYAEIFGVFRRRIEMGDATQITYLCNSDGSRSVRAALKALQEGREIASRIVVHEVFDETGIWLGEALPDWLVTAPARAERLVSG